MPSSQLEQFSLIYTFSCGARPPRVWTTEPIICNSCCQPFRMVCLKMHISYRSLPHSRQLIVAISRGSSRSPESPLPGRRGFCSSNRPIENVFSLTASGRDRGGDWSHCLLASGNIELHREIVDTWVLAGVYVHSLSIAATDVRTERAIASKRSRGPAASRSNDIVEQRWFIQRFSAPAN